MTDAPYDGSAPLKNARYERFAVAYCASTNATQSAKDAGYSVKTAHAIGHKLLKIAEIATRIKALRDAKLKALHMGADETLAELAKIARASMGRMLHITPGGDPYIDLSQADDDTLDAIESAQIEDFTDGREIDEEGKVIARDVRRVKVKMHSKVSALTTLMRHHGLLKDKIEVSLDEDFAKIMERQQRAAREASKEKNDG